MVSSGAVLKAGVTSTPAVPFQLSLLRSSNSGCRDRTSGAMLAEGLKSKR